MADLAGTYSFGTSPTINYTVSYTTARTAVDTVTTSVKVRISEVSGSSYFGYNITGYVRVNGVDDSVQTIKANLPNTWSTFDFTFPTITSTGVSATAKSFEAIVYLNSNSGRAYNTGSKTVSFPIGNTNAYWTSSKFCRVNPSGIIPENTSSLSVEWGGATDDQSNQIYYTTEAWANGNNVGYAGTAAQTGTTGTFNLSGYSEGASFFFRTYCRDEYNTGLGVLGVQSATVTKNLLTAAKISSSDDIKYDTISFFLTRTNASNTNSNTSFTYSLTCSGLTVYNSNVSSLGTGITVSIYRSGTVPTGPYILFSALKSLFASSVYTGSLVFILSTGNSYGTTKTSSCSVSVNLQTLPTSPTNLTSSGAYTIGSTSYFVINRRGITFSWGACTDPTGISPVYYDAEINTKGSWLRIATGLTSPSCTTPVISITNESTLKFRVKSRTNYGTESPWITNADIPIHYYFPPTISGLSVERTDTTKTTKGTIKKNTSISSLSYNFTIRFKNGTTVLAAQTPTATDTYDFSYTKTGMSDSETYTETITVSDNISSSIFGINGPQSSSEVIVPRYASMLTIREKGIGINAVAGDFASFAFKGTSTMYGGDPEGLSDGTLNFSVGDYTGLSGINYYIGAYVDSAGKLHASYSVPAYTSRPFIQVQLHFNPSAPIQYRYFSPPFGVSIPKDGVITDYGTIEYGSWAEFATADNINTIVGNAGYLKNSVSTNNLWKRRDMGSYYTATNPTGILCIPIGNTQSLTEYVFGEISLSWNLAANSSMCPKIWYTLYTSGTTPNLNGTYLTTINDATLRFGWNGTQRLVCIGQTTTSWNGLRTVNLDLITSNNTYGKPSATTYMNPFFSTTEPTFYGTTSALKRA